MSVDYCLAILDRISHSSRPVEFSELRDDSGIPQATLARLLKKLCALGYVNREKQGQYSGGIALHSMATACLNHSMSSRYKPFLKNLVGKTGLNAELYVINRQGPQLLCWEGGVSYFQVRMAPGHHLAHSGHPAIYFYWSLYPCEDYCVWDEPVDFSNLAKGEREDFQKQADKDNFIFERGHIRPELGRICAASPDGQFVYGLSGLLSEFQKSDDELMQILHEEITSYHGIGDNA